MTPQDQVFLLWAGGVSFFLLILMIAGIAYEEKKYPTTRAYIAGEVKATIHTRQEVSVRYSLRVSYRIKSYTEETIKEAVNREVSHLIAEWALTYVSDYVLSDGASSRLRYLLNDTLLDYVSARCSTVSVVPIGNWPKPPAPLAEQRPVTIVVQSPSPNRLQEHEYLAYERFVRRRIAGKLKDIDPTELE